MADSVDSLVQQSNGVYQPQFDQINQQLTQLPGVAQAQQAGLDQAKTNAFSDITDNANSRGMLYSGAPIAEQQRYVGATYLPAVAQLKQQQNDQTFSLQNSLNQLKQKQYQEALSTHNSQSQFEATQAEKQSEFQQRQALAEYKAQLAASSKGPTAQQTQQQFNTDLMGALNYAKQNPSKVQNGYRESVGQTLAQQYGYNMNDVMKAVGQVFPNGWEWKYQVRK